MVADVPPPSVSFAVLQRSHLNATSFVKFICTLLGVKGQAWMHAPQPLHLVESITLALVPLAVSTVMAP